MTCHIFGPNMRVSENSGVSPQIIHFNRIFHYKPSILGYPYFWKQPYLQRFNNFTSSSIELTEHMILAPGGSRSFLGAELDLDSLEGVQKTNEEMVCM